MYNMNEENTRGVIIGGDYIHFRLYFEDREQFSGYAQNDLEASNMAKTERDRLKAENPCLFRGDKWEVRCY